MDQLVLNNNIDSLFHTLENLTQKEGIIGKAVTHGDKTFLPVVSITVGYGSGSASMGKGQQSSSTYSSTSSSSQSQSPGTGALGLGAKICTDAVIVIDNQNNQSVTMLPVSSAAGSLMDKIPQIISGMNQNKQQSQSSSPSQS
jgi:uncharacterized spore protein YtfJ